MQLFSLMQRETAQASVPQGERWNSISRAVLHMNRYCDSNLKLEDYAEMCRMSKYHFLRVFKDITGAPPLEYRNRIRIEYAKELLENSYLSVFEIGEALGYTSPEYFSYAFKKATGKSPVKYRADKEK